MVPSVDLPKVPTLWDGKQFVDDRGTVSFVNEFDPYACGVRRFYTVRNVRAGYIRAWHGHKHEGKFVMVVGDGMAMVKAVSIAGLEKWKNESRPTEIHSWVLNGWQPKVLWIPKGYFNGFKSLKEGTDIMFFSTSTLDESKGDDIRLDYNSIGDNVWEECFR